MDGITATRHHALRSSHSISDMWRALPRTGKIAVGASAAAWVPTFFLALFGGIESLRWFLLDYAAQSRLLLVIPLLIIAEPALIARHFLIARRFLEEKLIREEDRAHFESILQRFQSLGNSRIVQAALLAFAFPVIGVAIREVPPNSLLPWCYHGDTLSPAGYWYAWVGLVIVIYLVMRWIWRQLLWAWFLGLVSHFNLRLIPAHPDRVAGLGFVATCHRKYVPFCFAIGAIAAGGVANRVLYAHKSLTEFKLIPVFLASIVVIICASPLWVFFRVLVDTKRSGVFEYGALANSLGRQFEQKWLAAKEDPSILEKQDFSASIDLYSIVANVNHMRYFLLPTMSVGRLAMWSVAPFIPVVVASIPFDIIVEHVLKHLI